MYVLSSHCVYVERRLKMLSMQGFVFFLKLSAQPLFTVFYRPQPKFKFDSS